MRYLGLGSLTALVLLAGCNSEPKPPQAPPSDAASVAATPAPAPNASDPDPTKAAGLWLDSQVEPRQPGKWAPRDECGTIPGARAFRERLAAAVQARDAEAIAAMATPDIRLGFGGQDGVQRFRAALKAPDGKLMNELAALLPLGCAGSDGGGLTVPWYFQQEVGDVDSYSAMLVTGVNVPLLAEAKPGAAVSETLSWDLVSLTKGLSPGAPFQQVKSAAGKTGYVATDKLRSLLAHRLLAVKQGQDWKITAVLAGD
ncbi:hypothetical protein [Novosphingobium sp. JCM 18896]|uniref:hypothetical protein n=1 Tax=Novosphingobium sp. JCM 18896 TaxID=2989731 RepID=UPI0022226633|nr:hypothetical protein [Novosphingobium sp. JCM 18896]MCW1427886.1 hypothetical protein [Novosphingobium sp. JCM 18896]